MKEADGQPASQQRLHADAIVDILLQSYGRTYMGTPHIVIIIIDASYDDII